MLKTVKITHNHRAVATPWAIVDLSETNENTEASYEATTPLVFQPTERRVINFSLTFREAQSVQLNKMTLSIETDAFAIEHCFTTESLFDSKTILSYTDDTKERRLLRTSNSTEVEVLPKAPKAELVIHGQRKVFYTDEIIRLSIQIINAEDEMIHGNVSAQTKGERDNALGLQWSSNDDSDVNTQEVQQSVDGAIVEQVSQLVAKESQILSLLVAAPIDPFTTTLEIAIDYVLETDTTVSLQKTVALEMNFVVPFEAKFTFGPLLYIGTWPSYFDPSTEGTETEPSGIPQLWKLSSQLRSLALEPVFLRSVEIAIGNVIGDSIAQVETQLLEERLTLSPGLVEHHSFQVCTKKHSLDDRRPTALESMLEIRWSVDSESKAFVTRIPIPRLNLPISEPRVLCTLDENLHDDWDVTLHYQIENPSNHFLTFAVTMDAHDDFAFAGPKYRALSLAPLSRHRVDYAIALHTEEGADEPGGRWISPALTVTDSYYQKTLRIHPAGPNVRLDERQNIEVWIE